MVRSADRTAVEAREARGALSSGKSSWMSHPNMIRDG